MLKMFSANYEAKYNSNKIETSEILLICKHGEFVEYNPKPVDKDFHIERIQLAIGACMGYCPTYQITINQDGSAYLLWSDINEYASKMKAGAYAAKLSPEEYNQISELLRYSDFRKLKDHYEVAHSCASASLLRITYNGGKVKQIEDVGKVGTYSLTAIYRIMDKIRLNHSWKSVKEPPGIRLSNYY